MFFSRLRSFVFNSQIFFNSPCLEGLGEHIWSFRSTVVPQRSQFVTKKVALAIMFLSLLCTQITFSDIKKIGQYLYMWDELTFLWNELTTL